MKTPIRVLIADDSSLARALLRQYLETDGSITVIGEASNGKQAVEMAQQLMPDLITMDIEMPQLTGIEAIQMIMSRRAIPILVVSSVTDAQNAYHALQAGALDVIEKPDYNDKHIHNLINKVKLLSGVSVFTRSRIKPVSNTLTLTPQPQTKPYHYQRVITIAASTGGPQALAEILPKLPHDYPYPIAIAQHIISGFTQGLADWLKQLCQLHVCVAQDGMLLQAGNIYICPAEKNMRLLASGYIRLEEHDAHEIYHPSCNLLLSSAAQAFTDKAVGLILTGMGRDGVQGMQAIAQHQGTTLAQDEASSIVYGMNREAIESGCIQQVLPLNYIAIHLKALAVEL